jgi:hypothetical protein
MKTQLFYILIISLCSPLTNIYGFIFGPAWLEQMKREAWREHKNETSDANICSLNGEINNTLNCPKAHTCSMIYGVNNTLNCPKAHTCSMSGGINTNLNCPSAQSCTVSGGINARCNTR